jgi:hypothetical protein
MPEQPWCFSKSLINPSIRFPRDKSPFGIGIALEVFARVPKDITAKKRGDL